MSPWAVLSRGPTDELVVECDTRLGGAGRGQRSQQQGREDEDS